MAVRSPRWMPAAARLLGDRAIEISTPFCFFFFFLGDHHEIREIVVMMTMYGSLPTRGAPLSSGRTLDPIMPGLDDGRPEPSSCLFLEEHVASRLQSHLVDFELKWRDCGPRAWQNPVTDVPSRRTANLSAVPASLGSSTPGRSKCG